MPKQDWLVTEDGNCLAFESPRQWNLLNQTHQYRLHRFLTELDDVINQAEIAGTGEADFLPDLRKLVRKLILNVHWVTAQVAEPSSKTGTSVSLLYDEPGFPLTVQTEVMLPGTCTTIHNHGTWGVVATLQGAQKNSLWKRVPTSDFPHNIELVREKVFEPGDIISFTTEVIHCVEAVGEATLVTLNIYGDTHAFKRFQFDPLTHQAHHF